MTSFLKKFNFVKDIGDIRPIPNEIYNYITNFVNSDFKKHFQIVIDKICCQFKTLYRQKRMKYQGYEVSGTPLSASGMHYRLHDLNILRLALRHCIDHFYNEDSQNWDYLKQFIYDKKRPIFVKRCFIPFLLQQLEFSHENKKEELFKAIKSILSLKKGLPNTEDIVMYELYSNKLLNIPEEYLKDIIESILYKYNSDKISYGIFLIQNLVYLISNEKTDFEKYLTDIISDVKFRGSYIYEDILAILAKNMNNLHIRNFVLNLTNDGIIDLHELYKQPWNMGDYKYGFLYEIIKSYWKNNDSRGSGRKILNQCLHDDDEGSIEFIAYFIENLSMETTSGETIMVEKNIKFHSIYFR